MESGISIITEEIGRENNSEIIGLSYKSPFKDNEGNIAGIVGITIDITQKEHFRRQLANERNQAKMALDNIIARLPGHVYWLDKNNRYLGCNDLHAQSAGLKNRYEVVDKTNADLAWGSQAEFLDNINNKVRTTGKEYCEEETAPIANGDIHTFLSRKTPLFDDEKNIIGMLGISFDITERKQMEQDLLIAKEKAEAANRAKTEFLANISHDVVTPLLSINILANNLLENHDEKNKENAELILSCQQQLSTFFKNCLDNANFELESPQLSEEFFSLTVFFQEIYNLFITNATQKKLSLNINIDDSAKVSVLGCRFILLRIVLNLVNNAVKFTENGGIAIEVNASTSSHKNEILLTISVQDTGIGIPEDKQACIFERLTRLAPAFSKRIEGSGIGLHIVDQYTKRMGGNIHVKSKVGEGSTFTVILPLKVASNNTTKYRRNF